MGSLNNPQPDITPVLEEPTILEQPIQIMAQDVPEEVQPAVSISWRDKFKMWLMRFAWYRRIVEQQAIQENIDQINTGQVARGRTVMNELPVIAGEISGVMGGEVMKAHTLLKCRHFRDGEEIGADYREIHNKVVTTAGRDAIVDAFSGTFTLSDFNYHAWGIGTGDEAVGDTTLGTACAEARVTGTKSQPSADVYQTVATITSEDTHAITEHGLLSASTNGTLFDRTKFAAINVISGDKIEFTFAVTFASGG